MALQRCCVPSVSQSAAFAIADNDDAWALLKADDDSTAHTLARFRTSVIKGFTHGASAADTDDVTAAKEFINKMLTGEGFDQLRSHAVLMFGTTIYNCYRQ